MLVLRSRRGLKAEELHLAVDGPNGRRGSAELHGERTGLLEFVHRFLAGEERELLRLRLKPLASGRYGAATASGWYGAATASGRYGAATASGFNGKAQASEGSAIFLCERDENGEIAHVFAGIAGRDGIKPDTFYTLRDGKPVEA